MPSTTTAKKAALKSAVAAIPPAAATAPATAPVVTAKPARASLLHRLAAAHTRLADGPANYPAGNPSPRDDYYLAAFRSVADAAGNFSVCDVIAAAFKSAGVENDKPRLHTAPITDTSAPDSAPAADKAGFSRSIHFGFITRNGYDSDGFAAYKLTDRGANRKLTEKLTALAPVRILAAA